MHMPVHLVTLLITTLYFSGLSSLRTNMAIRPAPQKPPSTLQLERGFLNFTTSEFNFKLVASSQTVAALKPIGGDDKFDFTPADLLTERSADGYFHLGDINIRLRNGNSIAWRDFSSAYRRKPVLNLDVASPTLASADITPTMGGDCPLQIVRSWAVVSKQLLLRFMLTNSSKEKIQIGSLGIPMVFNNIINNRNLDQAHALCSFYDPYIGQDAGYAKEVS